jgi:uncharacterized membrane protein YjgN (DUF898 family)
VKPEVIWVNWTGLARALQPEIMGVVGGLLLVLVVWLVLRSVIGRGLTGAGRARHRAWTDPGAALLALVIVGGLLWHVVMVVSVNRLSRQDVDGSSVYERMDAITKK